MRVSRHWSLRRILLAGVVIMTLLGLAGCYRPTGEDRSRILLSVDAEGGGRVEIVPASMGGSPDADLRAIGDRMAPQIFPTSVSRSVDIIRPVGAENYIRIQAAGVYQPGASATWHIDLRPAVSDLIPFASSRGVFFGHLEISVALPPVPVRARWMLEPARSEENYWEWDDVSAGPSGSVIMTPQPWRGILVPALSLASLILMMVSFLAGRISRAVTAGSSLICVLIATAALILSSSPRFVDLGVAGLLSGRLLTLLGFMPILAVVAALGGAIILVRSAIAASPDGAH